MSGTSFGTFWDFLTIFEQFSFFHWKSMIFRKNSKNPYFDLWDLLWWVFHMVLGLNHWFRPKNEGSKKSVPQNCKSAGSDALKYFLNGFARLQMFNLSFDPNKYRNLWGDELNFFSIGNSSIAPPPPFFYTIKEVKIYPQVETFPNQELKQVEIDLCDLICALSMHLIYKVLPVHYKCVCKM